MKPTSSIYNTDITTSVHVVYFIEFKNMFDMGRTINHCGWRVGQRFWSYIFSLPTSHLLFSPASRHFTFLFLWGCVATFVSCCRCCFLFFLEFARPPPTMINGISLNYEHAEGLCEGTLVWKLWNVLKGTAINDLGGWRKIRNRLFRKIKSQSPSRIKNVTSMYPKEKERETEFFARAPPQMINGPSLITLPVRDFWSPQKSTF